MTAEAKHLAMHHSGLLSGPLDARTMAAWPQWAQEHAGACAECQGLIRAVALSDAVALSESMVVPPTPDSLRLRHRRRQRIEVPPLSAFLPPPPDDYRLTTAWRGAEALELSRSADGPLHLWDPQARYLAAFQVEAGKPATLLGEARSTGGASLDVEPEPGTWLVTVASAHDLLTSVVGYWLSLSSRDTPTWDPTRVQSRIPANRVRLRADRVAPPFLGDRIRVSRHEVPPPSSELQELLSRAASAGRSVRLSEATALYSEVSSRAQLPQDASAYQKSRVGLATCLYSMGFEDDARDTLEDLVTHHELRPDVASNACRKLGLFSMTTGRLDEAERWLDRTRALGDHLPHWQDFQRARLAMRRGDYDEALDGFARIREFDDQPLTLLLLHLLEATARSRVGQHAQALAALSRVDDDIDHPELALYQVAARAEVLGEDPDLDAVVAALDRVTGERASETLREPVLLAASHALDSAPERAASLIRALHTRDPHDTSSLVVEDHLVVLPGQRQATRLADPAEIRHRARALREGVQAGRPLGDLPLGPALHTEATRFMVASHGLLDGIPWTAALWASGDGPPPVVTHRVEGQRRAPPARTSAQVASLADASGDLPGAHGELERERADIWLRGAHVRAPALSDLGPIGLLHIAVHATRRSGVPELLLADGPLASADIARLELQGGPVVLLTGCATGARVARWGSERSFADGFLRAGASAVIATLWPVDDAHMTQFVSALLEHWPFECPASAVASTRVRLRERGLPPLAWAAPVVYA